MKGDYCTREGAERLKEQIEAYWAERGHEVRVNLVQGGFLAFYALCAHRCTLYACERCSSEKARKLRLKI